MDELKNELKKYIIEELNLEDMSPEEIGDDEPLFGDGLGLDSIDALELVVILEQYYGIKIKDEKTGREVFHSIDTMAEYVEKHRTA